MIFISIELFILMVVKRRKIHIHSINSAYLVEIKCYCRKFMI